MTGGRAALWVLSGLVPRYRRAEWREEWEGELEALLAHRTQGEDGAYPSVAGFVAGALPHALWIRMEGWTMESVAQDLKYAARGLRRAPAFTLVAALTLALGIGANAAMFSLVNGLFFRAPAGIGNPDALVQVARSYDDAPRWDNWSWPAAELIREEGSVFSGVAGYSGSSFVLGTGEQAEPLLGQYVSGGYFQVLQVQPHLGRLFDPSDEVAPGAHPVAVLSHGLWTRRFGADPGIVGTTVSLGSAPYEVVGVAPEGFAGVDALGSVPELWVPAFQRTLSNGRLPFDQWGSSWFFLFARLNDGVSFAAATASMDAVSMSLRASSDINDGMRVLLAPGVGLAPEERAEGGRVMILLAAIATLVLLLTCANVGNLYLARATARVGEVGVRQALGAGRGRLVRQMITESVVLALVAAVLAVPVVGLGSAMLPSLVPWGMTQSVAPDLRVYGFLVAVGLLAGLLFGALPAWAISRRDVASVLREGGTTGGRQRTRLRDALVVGQLALSLGLVSGAALLGRSVLNARSASPGFDARNVLVGFVNLRATGRYQGDEAVGFQERLVNGLTEMPGVLNAALASQAPILGGHARATVVPADRADDPTLGFEAEETSVTHGYFETLGIPVVRGRTFRRPEDEPEPVVVINQALAQRFWPGEDAVGKALAGPDGPIPIVGVVADVQMRSLRAPANPGVYYPFHQQPATYLAVHLKTAGPPTSLLPSLRRAVADVDAQVPITGLADLREGIARSLSETRTFVFVVATFAGLALALSLIGLYGLIVHGVAQRAREMGIRIALGADQGTLIRLVLGRAVAISALGIGLGVGVALLLGRGLRGVLFGVSPSDPVVLGGAALLLLGAALVAAWLPARRAGRVDAAVSLRES